MLKGFFIYYILSLLTGNPFLAIILLFVIYAFIDKAYFRFLPDFSAPFKRNARIKALTTELQLNPANATSAQELGTLYFEKKRFAQALEYLNKAYEKVKDSGRLYLYLGMSYMELGREEEGQEALRKALELEPKVGRGLPYIYLLRYEINRSQQNAEEIASLEEKFADFANTENFFRMGMVYKRLGEKQKARQMFEGALKEYSYVPKSLRRIHRKWAIFASVQKFLMG